MHLDMALLQITYLNSPAYLYVSIFILLYREMGWCFSWKCCFQQWSTNMLIFLHQGNNFHLENSFQNYWILIQSPLLYPLWAITFRNKIPFFSDQIFAKINKLQKNLFLSSKRFRFKFLTRSTILNKVVRCYQYNSQPSLYCKRWKLIMEAE